MASSRKRTWRLEVNLSADDKGGTIVNYRELVEKAMAASGKTESTPPASPLPKAVRNLGGQLLPDLRRKPVSWNIPDFRALAEGYEEDSFIDDSEMFEESIPDSQKFLGYRIRSQESDNSEIETETHTHSGYSLESDESDSDSPSIIELDDFDPPTKKVFKEKEKLLKVKEKSKTNSEQQAWSEFLKRVGQNDSMEIITINSNVSISSTVPSSPPPLVQVPRPRPPSPGRGPRTSPRASTSPLVAPSATKSHSDPATAERAGNKTPVGQHARAGGSPRAIIMVDLCNSPQGKQQPAPSEAAEGDAASTRRPPPCPALRENAAAAAAPVAATSTSKLVVAAETSVDVETGARAAPAADDGDCSPRSQGPVVSSTVPRSCSPDSAFASSSTDVSPNSDPHSTTSSDRATFPDALAKPGSASKRGAAAAAVPKPTSNVTSGKPNQVQRSQSVDSSKRSKTPQLSAKVVTLLEEVITKHSADEKWKCEKQDDALLRLGEACLAIPPMDRMFVYERLATRWNVPPKQVSRRLSLLRATRDKQPVKDCISRLQLLLIAESKHGMHPNKEISAASMRLVAEALRAKSQWLQRHTPRKGGAVEALEGFARKELLALWGPGGPGAAAYGPHAHVWASAAIERELHKIAPGLVAATATPATPATPTTPNAPSSSSSSSSSVLNPASPQPSGIPAAPPTLLETAAALVSTSSAGKFL